MAQENVEIVLRAMAGFNARDADAALGEFADDAEYKIAEEHPESRTCRGVAEIRAYLEEWWRQFSDLRFELEEFHDRGELVAARGRARGIGTESGAEVVIPIAYVCTVRDGRIVRAEEFLNPDRAFEAAGIGG